MSLEDDLRKENKELKKLVEELNDRMNGIEKENRKASSNKIENLDNKVSETEGSIKAFSLSLVSDVQGLFSSAIDSFGSAINIIDGQVYEKLNNQATTIQKTFGLTKARISEFKALIADTTPELVKMGYTEQEALSTITGVMKGLGTAASVSQEAITEIGAAAKLSGEEAETLASNFRDVGVSVYNVGDEMKTVVNYAKSVGVSVETIAGDVSKNLKQLNLYNFDNGVKGLAKMAATSERMGISMTETFRIAEDLFSPEKAINLAAGLQRLGVTANGLLDPLRAMSLAENDPEQLQKEIVNLSKEFTTFNEKTGKMEILPGAKRRLREIAGELNIDADKFAAMSIKAGDFDRKLQQIKMPSFAEGDQETKELIASMAQLKDGVATIQVKDAETGFITEKEVDQLTSDDIKNLQKANEDSSKTIEQIAMDQLTETEQINTLLQSGKLALEFGRATSPTLEKAMTTVAGSKLDVAKRYAGSIGGAAGVRRKAEGVARPVEDYIYGTVKGESGLKEEAKLAFEKGFADLASSFKQGFVNFVAGVKEDTIKNVEQNYSRNTEPKTLNINVKVEGDANTSKMDKKEISNTLKQVIQDPNTANEINSGLNGGTAPSAITGGKNNP
ncbi:MAG: hypothetical protein EBU90_11915 [Proteobacteria bacterium]|nr:hypothetical protein [Pseudomonadota bacterium]